MVGALVGGALLGSLALAHGVVEPVPVWEKRRIVFPDTAEHLTLVADLHTHSVFSDGHVWPRIRVAEAHRDGLDALAITEHLEWQPHLADLPHPDRNRAFEAAKAAAVKLEDLLLVPGVEITREMPAGHMNAIFIEDANRLVRAPVPEDPADARGYYAKANAWPAQEAVAEANRQGAFVFWNHPFWNRQQPDGIAKMNDFHRQNAKAGLLHGIEIANGRDFSHEAFALALEYGLTMLGVSDIHQLIDWDYPPHLGKHRPVTLVFAKARSLAALREALFAGRTVVWFGNLLAGREAEMTPLLQAAIRIEAKGYRPDTQVLSLRLANRSDAHFLLQSQSPYTFMESASLVELPPHSDRTLGLKTGGKTGRLELVFQVQNALTAPETPATLSVSVQAEG